MKFLDSNIIAYAFYNNEHTTKCQEAIKQGGLVDAFNLVEAFFIIEKETGSKELAQQSMKAILKSDIQIIEVNLNLIFETLKRVATYKRLSIFDLLHYTCALLNGCDTVLSYDGDFDNLELPRKEP